LLGLLLASVALRPTAAAAGPSKLIQALLQVGSGAAGKPWAAASEDGTGANCNLLLLLP
jgi:hypothetical protein